MQAVNSSNVSSIGYDMNTEELDIEFSSGKTYAYADVPYDTYQALLNAPSIGKFVRANIINKFSQI